MLPKYYKTAAVLCKNILLIQIINVYDFYLQQLLYHSLYKPV